MFDLQIALLSCCWALWRYHSSGHHKFTCSGMKPSSKTHSACALSVAPQQTLRLCLSEFRAEMSQAAFGVQDRDTQTIGAYLFKTTLWICASTACSFKPVTSFIYITAEKHCQKQQLMTVSCIFPLRQQLNCSCVINEQMTLCQVDSKHRVPQG